MCIINYSINWYKSNKVAKPQRPRFKFVKILESFACEYLYKINSNPSKPYRLTASKTTVFFQILRF